MKISIEEIMEKYEEAFLMHAVYIDDNIKSNRNWLNRKYEQEAYYLGREAGKMEAYADLLGRVLSVEQIQQFKEMLFMESDELKERLKKNRA